MLQRAGGNPLFLRELSRMMALDPDPNDHSIPTAIRAVIDGHLGLLPAESQRLLQIASVAGQAFEATTLSSSYGEAVALVLERLRPAVRAEILRRCSRSEFEFTNPLYHQHLCAS